MINTTTVPLHQDQGKTLSKHNFFTTWNNRKTKHRPEPDWTEARAKTYRQTPDTRPGERSQKHCCSEHHESQLQQRHKLSHTVNKISHHRSLNQASHPSKQDTSRKGNIVTKRSDQPRITEETWTWKFQLRWGAPTTCYSNTDETKLPQSKQQPKLPWKRKQRSKKTAIE